MTKQQSPVWIEIVDGPIDVDSLRAWVADPDVGSIGWFEGVTRRTTAGKVTETLFYEAHRPMAISLLQKLGELAVDKFSLCKLAIVHRLGEVSIGEPSVVVACSSGHRPATFSALPWIMDALKRDVPIWKQEIYADGTTEWIHPVEK